MLSDEDESFEFGVLSNFLLISSVMIFLVSDCFLTVGLPRVLRGDENAEIAVFPLVMSVGEN